MATSTSSPIPSTGSAANLLTVRVVHRDGAAVVHLDGDVDLVTVSKVAAAVNECLASDPGVLILDMTGVNFVCSSGVSLLMDIEERTHRSATRLCLVSTRREVLRPLQLLGLRERFLIRPSVARALRELTGV